MAVIDSGNDTPNKANVDEQFNLRVNTPGYSSTGVAVGGGPENGPAMFSENDPGVATGVRSVASPETDDDYRLRIAIDTPMDSELFNYAAQNTGKHSLVTTAMTVSFGATGLLTNAGHTGSVNTGVTFGTYAPFPLMGAAHIYYEFELALTEDPPTNTVVNFGAFLRGTATAYTPTDGAYFQLENGVWNAVLMYNTVPTIEPLPAAAMAYTAGVVRQYIVAIHQRRVDFWVNNVLVISIPTPPTNGTPALSGAYPASLSHSIVGGASADPFFKVNLRAYSVGLGGYQAADTLSSIGNRMYGSYQGLSGAAMGSLANYVNSTSPANNPAPAVPANATAQLGPGLGGQFWETDSAAVSLDCIICSFQNVASGVAYAGRRLVVRGVKIDSYVQATLTGGGYNAQWSLAFGHTAVSLATTETATTKAPRRLTIGSNSVAANAVALTQLATVSLDLGDAPVYVNPGEFIAVVKKKIGTAPTVGTIAHMITIVAGWE